MLSLPVRANVGCEEQVSGLLQQVCAACWALEHDADGAEGLVLGPEGGLAAVLGLELGPEHWPEPAGSSRMWVGQLDEAAATDGGLPNVLDGRKLRASI